MTYHRRYGYPWRWAIAAEFWWRVEHLGYYRGGEGGLCAYVNRFGYVKRKAAERRGVQA
jgi:hypothetical protein